MNIRAKRLNFKKTFVYDMLPKTLSLLVSKMHKLMLERWCSLRVSSIPSTQAGKLTSVHNFSSRSLTPSSGFNRHLHTPAIHIILK